MYISFVSVLFATVVGHGIVCSSWCTFVFLDIRFCVEYGAPQVINILRKKTGAPLRYRSMPNMRQMRPDISGPTPNRWSDPPDGCPEDMARSPLWTTKIRPGLPGGGRILGRLYLVGDEDITRDLPIVGAEGITRSPRWRSNTRQRSIPDECRRYCNVGPRWKAGELATSTQRIPKIWPVIPPVDAEDMTRSTPSGYRRHTVRSTGGAY